GASALRKLQAPDPTLAQAADYFDNLAQVARVLEEMAESQRAHRPFTDWHMAFINEMIAISKGCTGFSAPGWFLKLFFAPSSANEAKPTIADVHTDPQNGNV